MLSSKDFRFGPDAAWIEIESLFYWVCDFSLDSGFSGVQDMNMQDFRALSFFVSCINIFDSSLYKMYVLIQFVLLCQNTK